MSTSALFKPIQVGELTLRHRVVHAPLTRFRANDVYVPSPLTSEYYAQRASTPGTLLIAEATLISPQAGGFTNVPGIYSEEQLAAWRKIVDGVHAKGSYIYLQLWAVGRAAYLGVLRKEGHPYVSASDIQLFDPGVEQTREPVAPRPLTIPEIKQYIQDYATAATNAVNVGFDGVEVHGAHGYLVDQFLQDVSNKRTDEYGGSIENRARFGLEVIDAISEAIGANKTAIRISPWSRYQDMGMPDPKPTFTYFVQHLRERHPDLAYLHVVEPRVDGPNTREAGVPQGQSNDFIRALWAPLPLISAGGFDRALGIDFADHKGDLIAYGRPYIANPDLPFRLKYDIPLAVPDRRTYYVYGSTDTKGYIDYPFADVAKL
ncbi:hypothetical protein PLICRDRAFT_169021 [Plicaturopsis crispa FD-325 SS-3]|uniref:NADH:flavin oxidoreductase/NADH oxidase N-terminal domain-containing protein n=1 Tax=Plicaturopsis crispa FD-325 SS-3 TaxID=944288 RepID=A0A0C9SQ31_PLICR|nr:hypothetical protein PLICRDRAFT_169021 [Plicaturopsis crispa FD-325 SS-3]